MIYGTLTREQAASLFDRHAVFMSGHDVIYDYKIAEIFGEEICKWVENCMGLSDSFFKGGTDWNSWGECRCHYFYRSGFNKIVSQHNYLSAVRESQESEGGAVWDSLWKARDERLEARQAEEDRIREERKAKRKAAMEAKRAATEGKEETQE